MRIQIIATYHSNCWGNDCIHSCHHASNTCTFPKMHIRHGCHMWMYDWQLCQGKKLICCIFFNWYSFNPRFYRGTVLKREKEKVVRFIFCYKQSKKSCLGKYLKAGFFMFPVLIAFLLYQPSAISFINLNKYLFLFKLRNVNVTWFTKQNDLLSAQEL